VNTAKKLIQIIFGKHKKILGLEGGDKTMQIEDFDEMKRNLEIERMKKFAKFVGGTSRLQKDNCLM